MNDLLTLDDLADRWKVTRRTARAATRRDSFPAPVAVSARNLRWVSVEVTEWEHNHGRHKARKKRLPKATGQPMPIPARITQAA